MIKIIEKPQELRISDIGHEYAKQWVTVEVTKRDEYGFPLNGKVLLLHGSSAHDLRLDKIEHLEGDLYTFYTGSIGEVNSGFEYYTNN